jgi:hypothetical protein
MGRTRGKAHKQNSEAGEAVSMNLYFVLSALYLVGLSF